MKWAGIIFDLDGTLLDSMSMWRNMGEKYLRSLGIEPRPGLRETLRAMSLLQAACHFQEEYGIASSTEEIMDSIDHMLFEYYKNEVVLKEGALDLLKRLTSEGIPVCIATATDRTLVEAGLCRTGIREYFSSIFTCREVGAGKSSPLIYQKALASLGTAKENTVVFEDALHAAKTARRDGFPVAGVYDKEEENNQAELRREVNWYFQSLLEAVSYLDV